MITIEKLKCKLGMPMPVQNIFDPSRFGGPVAPQTAWTPTKKRRSEFSHPVLFFLFGLGMFIAFCGFRFSPDKLSDGFGTAMPLVISLLFSAIGAYMLYAGTSPIVFEKGRGVFWKGRKGPDHAVDNRKAGRYVRPAPAFLTAPLVH